MVINYNGFRGNRKAEGVAYAADKAIRELGFRTAVSKVTILSENLVEVTLVHVPQYSGGEGEAVVVAALASGGYRAKHKVGGDQFFFTLARGRLFVETGRKTYCAEWEAAADEVDEKAAA